MIHLIKRLKKWLDIKSPSKDMMRGWTREDVDAIIEEMEF